MTLPNSLPKSHQHAGGMFCPCRSPEQCWHAVDAQCAPGSPTPTGALALGKGLTQRSWA